jgi:hypothetical protein
MLFTESGQDGGWRIFVLVDAEVGEGRTLEGDDGGGRLTG